MGIGLSRRGLLVGALAAPALVGLSGTASATVSSGLRGQLRDIEAGYPGRIGVAAFNTGDGAAAGYRAHERFALASTFKTLAAAAILRKARLRDPGLLDRLIRYDRGELVVNSPVTEQHVDSGLTVAELCDAVITYSDNTAGNLLLKQLGGPRAITAFTRTLGDFRTRLDRRQTLDSAVEIRLDRRWGCGNCPTGSPPVTTRRACKRSVTGSGPRMRAYLLSL
jgi:beta-lactamase class A